MAHGVEFSVTGLSAFFGLKPSPSSMLRRHSISKGWRRTYRRQDASTCSFRSVPRDWREWLQRGRTALSMTLQPTIKERPQAVKERMRRRQNSQRADHHSRRTSIQMGIIWMVAPL